MSIMPATPSRDLQTDTAVLAPITVNPVTSPLENNALHVQRLYETPVLDSNKRLFVALSLWLLGSADLSIQLIITASCQNEFSQRNPYLIAGLIMNLMLSFFCISMFILCLFSSWTNSNSLAFRFINQFSGLYAPISLLPAHDDAILAVISRLIVTALALLLLTTYLVDYAAEHVSLSLSNKKYNQAVLAGEIAPAIVFILTPLLLHLIHGTNQLKNNCHARFFRSHETVASPPTERIEVLEPLVFSEL